MGLGPFQSFEVCDPEKKGEAAVTAATFSTFGLRCRLIINGILLKLMEWAPPTEDEIDAAEYGNVNTGSDIMRTELAKRRAVRTAR